MSQTHKAINKLWFLRRNRNCAPSELKLMASIRYIRPTLEYAASVWDPYKKNQIGGLEKVHRKAVRFILSKYKRLDSVTDLLNSLKAPLIFCPSKNCSTKVCIDMFFSLVKY